MENIPFKLISSASTSFSYMKGINKHFLLKKLSGLYIKLEKKVKVYKGTMF
jgi:hypothetical protein